MVVEEEIEGMNRERDLPKMVKEEVEKLVSPGEVLEYIQK